MCLFSKKYFFRVLNFYLFRYTCTLGFYLKLFIISFFDFNSLVFFVFEGEN